MKLFKAILTERVKRTPTIESFRFRPEEKIDFLPGQFLQVIFDPANPNNKDLNKYLSFSSSPDKNYFEFTKRLSSSPFSERLKSLPLDTEIQVKAPIGNCVFKDEYRKIGFLVGGIGITPVISIIEYIMEKKLSTDACLAYSNRTEEEIAFKRELNSWRQANANIKIIYVVTECEPKDKTCIFGRIDSALIKKSMCDIEERVVFIYGPPKMVEAMKEIAIGLKVAPENLRSEAFVGY